MNMMLSETQRLDWLRLIRSESVGPRTFRSLINTYGSVQAALEALPDLARKSGRLMLKVTTQQEAEAEYARIMQRGARLIAMGEPDYPKRLLQTYDAPPLLLVRGNGNVLTKPMVAIVGSRNASAAGCKLTQTLARDLSEAGLIVVSGLARGIDTHAHQASLNTGTVAVLAGGHDRPYPPQNIPLMESMLDKGAVISEMPMGWEPRGRDFPRRNRIVSGLSYGVIVVEAALKSGSLITARFANEQGRDVFAVPGSPLDPRAQGTNDLIRQGAALCACADDVLNVITPMLEREEEARGAFEEDASRRYSSLSLWDELDLNALGIDEKMQQSQKYIPQSEGEAYDNSLSHEPLLQEQAVSTRRQALTDALSTAPIGIDDLARMADVPVRYAQTVLLELELSGHVERHVGGAVSLRST
jgi:DNA processing protein